MSINLLPDDCLLHIFYAIHETHTLYKCLRVNKRWNLLVNYRLKKAERLLDWLTMKPSKLDEKSIWHDAKSKPLTEPTLSKILKKSPKLKVVCLGFQEYACKEPGWYQNCINRLFELESLEGLVLSNQDDIHVTIIPPFVKSLISYTSSIKRGYYPMIKHIIFEDTVFVDCIHRFPNVEWLQLRIGPCDYDWFTTACINQHLFKNLKVLELDASSYEEGEGRLYQLDAVARFINFCPQLESAHLCIPINQPISESILRHQNLTNLVLTFEDLGKLEDSLSNLQSLLRKFPNIKHLTIDYLYELNDENSVVSGDSAAEVNIMDDNEHEPNNIENEGSESDDVAGDESGFVDDDDNRKKEPPEPKLNKICRLLPEYIVQELQKLELLYMRDIIGVDESSRRSVQSMSNLRERPIKFYYGKAEEDTIERDCPDLFDESRDSSAFKFMSKHFLRPHCDIFKSIILL